MKIRINQFLWLPLILAGLACGCAGMGNHSRHSQETRIVADLEARARAIRSYAEDFTIQGQKAKRMYFQFERDGKPFFRFRSDFIRAGKRYVYIYNADGHHDYHYFPDERIAYRCPTDGLWNTGNYDKAKKAQFNYHGAVLDGETAIGGRACYLLKFQHHWIAVWKEKGIPLAAMNRPNRTEDAVYYENIKFDLPDDDFKVPSGVTIIDRKDGFFK